MEGWFSNMSDKKVNTLPMWTGKEKFFLVTTIIAVVAAAVGFDLWRTAVVPDDAAAKVGDTYISESEVASSINQYRSSYSLTDDTTYASALAQQGLTPNTFRRQVIDELATSKLVEARAKELGLVPTDEEVDAQYNTAKSSMSFNSEEVWKQTLEQYGMTESALRDQIRVSLEKQNLYEAEVSRQEASDADALSYAQSQLPGVSQSHYYRMVFTGSDAATRANAAHDELAAMKSAGTLNADTFAQMARERSNDDDVASTGGSFAWAVEISSDEDLAGLATGLAVGDLSEAGTVESDGDAVEILYCDTKYTFPSSTEISSLTASDVPASLWAVVKSQASDSLYSTACSTYLSNLLANGKVTYYPMPANASYNIPITVTSTSDSN